MASLSSPLMRLLQEFSSSTMGLSIPRRTSKKFINRPFRLNWGYFGGSGGPKGSGSNQGRDGRGSFQNKKQGNDGQYQVYVGDLDGTVTKQHLMDHFRKKYHSVIDGKIITDQATKLSKGYGFVQFSNFDEYQRAITEMQGTLIKGKPVKVSQGQTRTPHGSGNSKGNSNDRNSASAQLNQLYGTTGNFCLI